MQENKKTKSKNIGLVPIILDLVREEASRCHIGVHKSEVSNGFVGRYQVDLSRQLVAF